MTAAVVAFALAFPGMTGASNAPSGPEVAASSAAPLEVASLALEESPTDESALPLPEPSLSNPAIKNGREYLVPELADSPFKITEGPRPYQHRLAFSPATGQLGSNPLYSMRVSYNPNAWLGWEAAIGHNPGEGVHALTHSLSAQVRYPLPWRLQPYGSLGYGMIFVYPGEALNADPVTSNVLYAGGGLEFFIRNDLAVRAEMRSATVLDTTGSDGETVAFDYGEATWGLSFYRGLGN